MSKKITYNEIEKWLLANGWKATVHEETRDAMNARNEVVYERRITFHKYKGNFWKTQSWAKYEHVYTIITDKWGCRNKSNWYSFYAHGKNFTVENRITHRMFTIEQIEGALNVTGIE